ncbi:hypothetical protein BT96DRAFT_1087775 [Gymnopus androsaceus JB14]|uniref:Uncharacterized protein n=1 Tax=Gymnopus androsaceus JB14 TaxID=1447944 RepID=A0A6A4I0L9_9AGAR|nr:hypothetical protein BT96DRAFT_1087775 [Gymnopus androsaceus JB14]
MGGFLNCIGIRNALKSVLKSRGYDGIECDSVLLLKNIPSCSKLKASRLITSL